MSVPCGRGTWGPQQLGPGITPPHLLLAVWPPPWALDCRGLQHRPGPLRMRSLGGRINNASSLRATSSNAADGGPPVQPQSPACLQPAITHLLALAGGRRCRGAGRLETQVSDPGSGGGD